MFQTLKGQIQMPNLVIYGNFRWFQTLKGQIQMERTFLYTCTYLGFKP